jgi:TetR/AcrR family transcriptional regulator, regulator of cefoperazone and chloramphenicol sensitivity
MATADDTKQRLLEAAGIVFAQKGFRDATVREICQGAQANLAAVNYYFGDKERLYIESVKRAHARRLEAVPLPAWRSDTPPEYRLRDFIETLLSRILGDPRTDWHGQLMLREMLYPTAACAELVDEFIRPQFELLQSIVAELSPALEGEPLRLIAFGIVGQCLYFRIANPVVHRLVAEAEHARFQPSYLADHITRWTLAALGRRPLKLPASERLEPPSAAVPSVTKVPSAVASGSRRRRP